jgi:ankyrin repeat protein
MRLIKNLFGKSLNEKLRDAIENKNYSEVKSLVSQGANVNCVYKNEITPLHLASRIMGDLGIVELLINNGANVKATTENGYNSLMVACVRNDTELVELLLKNKSDVNQKSKNGWTPLILASGNISLNSIFFQNNKMGLEIFQLLDTQKFYHIKNNPEQIVCSLIKSGSNIKHKNKFNNSPLDEAIFSCNTEVIKCLLDNGANVEDANDFGDTPLIKVCGYKFDKYRESIITLLDRIWDMGGFGDEKSEIRFRIKSALLNNLKNKPQNEQIESFNSEMLKIANSLIHYGANIKAKNSVGASAIIAASGEGNTKIANLLIKSGADVNDRYDTDMSALFIAAQKGNIEIIKVLLQNGADIDSPLNDGETALMTAVWFGHVEVVNLLVLKGANINAKKITPYNKDGEKVLDWAVYKFKNERNTRYAEIFNILHNAGAR